MHLTILTLGSRGDVQPFVALALGLQESGHDVRICASERFEPFIRNRGLGYAHMSDRVLELVQSEEGRRAVERGGRSLPLLWRAMPELKECLRQQWEACEGADAIIAHPYSIGGPHIAERLGLPCIVAAPLPVVTPTGVFPSPLLAQTSLGRPLNRFTHSLVNGVLNGIYRALLRSSHREIPALAGGSANGTGTNGTGRPEERRTTARRSDVVLYAYSPHLVPDPGDWPESTSTTGYWLLDRDDDWNPTPELERFIEAGPAPVYIGFGSMLVRDPERFTATVLEALDRTGQRAVLATGWGR